MLGVFVDNKDFPIINHDRGSKAFKVDEAHFHILVPAFEKSQMLAILLKDSM